MRGNLIRNIVGVSMVLAVGACVNELTKSDTTAPETSEPLASPVSAAGAEVVRFKIKGPFAGLFFVTEVPGGVLLGDLRVERVEGQRHEETLLFYSIVRCSLTGGECVPIEEGSGLIPNGDFVVGRREARLRTNITGDPNSNFQVITGSGGRISIRWTRTSAFSTSFHSHARTKSPGISIEHFQSAGTFWSALAEGTLFGIGVNTFGNLGTMRNGLVIILKGT
jgi:hypothetical protein